MSVQQPIQEHIRVIILDPSQETISELQHIQVTTLETSQGIILGSMQELLPIRAHTLETSQETTLDTIQVLETIQAIMPAILVERIQATSLVQQ